MPNNYFSFKKFTVNHDRCAMKVTTDGSLFGAWVAEELSITGSHLKTALDIGTGTGLLSLMIAQKNNILIDAVEIDAEAAVQARQNVTPSPFKESIFVEQANILNFKQKSYDCIFSNPPFYQNELKSVGSKKNIAHHDEGLLLKDLFTIISSRLHLGGVFFLLLPAKRELEIDPLLKENNLFILKKLSVKQSVNHSTFRILIKGTNDKNKPAEKDEVLSIYDDQKQYTPAFVQLLKDYYLYL